MKDIVIIGAGGNSKVIMDALLARATFCHEDVNVLGFLDDDQSKKTFLGFPILGAPDCAEELTSERELCFINGIGNNQIRQEMFQSFNLNYYTLVHPGALIAPDVELGAGTVVMPGAIINTGSVIGKGVIINTGAIVEHDNVIGDFVHMASASVTAGNVKIGNTSMLGTGARVIQGITIGTAVMVGAGAVVIKDIPNNCTAVGVPAKIIKMEEFR